MPLDADSLANPLSEKEGYLLPFMLGCMIHNANKISLVYVV